MNNNNDNSDSNSDNYTSNNTNSINTNQTTTYYIGKLFEKVSKIKQHIKTSSMEIKI